MAQWLNKISVIHITTRTVHGGNETRSAAKQLIHQAVDEVVADSAEQYMEEQQKAVSHLNARLADALADLRQQKAATEANKTKGDISGDAES